MADHLLYFIVDLLASGNWQRGGGKGQRPKRLSPLSQPKGTTYGAGMQLPQDVILELLAARGPRRSEPELWVPESARVPATT